jgi:hypothetical protein
MKPTKEELPPWGYKDFIVLAIIGVVFLLGFFSGDSNNKNNSFYPYVQNSSSPKECFNGCMNHYRWDPDKSTICEIRCDFDLGVD